MKRWFGWLGVAAMLAACGADSGSAPKTGTVVGQTAMTAATEPGTIAETARAVGQPAGSTAGTTGEAVRLPLVAASAASATSEPRRVAPPYPLTAPSGFEVSVLATGLGAARGMALDRDGRVYVTDIDGGRVLRLAETPDAQGLRAAEVVASKLNQPHGIVFHDDQMYVGETQQIVRFVRNGAGWGSKEIVIPKLPTGGHRTRSMVFGADGKLYVSVGSSCNVCIEQDERRAAIWQYNADGSGGRLFSRGLRNAVGIAVRPGSNEIWVTNNGRDNMGDDVPPDTLNVLKDGEDFGWPRCHAGRIVDPEFGRERGCAGAAKATQEIQAHSAPLGLAFYEGRGFAEPYRTSLFVAFHGSWNRSIATGYKVARMSVDAQGRPGPVEDFVVGWYRNGAAWGRPVDILVAPDGSLLVSDDMGGRIFRIEQTSKTP
ncbi:MAG: sorbosone dehydrogenase family protein [Herpetosiphon sp.]